MSTTAIAMATSTPAIRSQRVRLLPVLICSSRNVATRPPLPASLLFATFPYRTSENGRRDIGHTGLRANIALTLVAFAVACGGAPPRGLVSFTTHDADPAWSPDGRLIAFVSNRGFGTNHYRPGLYVVRTDGGGLRRLVSGMQVVPRGGPTATGSHSRVATGS